MRALLLTTGLFVSSVALADAKPATNAEASTVDGHAAWFDLTTTSMTKSKDFYGKLFGWTFTPVMGTDLAATIVAGSDEVGSLRIAEGKIGAFNGVVYIAVADMTAACAKATSLGGVVPPGFPFNIPGKGAIALVTDPAGHPIGLYSKTLVPDKAPAKK